MDYQFRTKAACRIVGLEFSSFQDAIGRHLYPCAPATIAGAARTFDIDNLVVLYLYARLLGMGLTREGAGRAACELHRHIEDAQGEGLRLDLVDTGFGTFDAVLSKADDALPVMLNNCKVLSCWSHDLDHLRAYVKHMAAKELATVGDE